MIDEQARRKPEFSDDAVPIRLADGQEWYVPLPPGELILTSLDGDFAPAPGWGSDWDAKIAALSDASKANEVTQVVRAAFGIAVYQLRRNYDLDLTDLQALLPWRPREEQNKAMWHSLMDAARGVGEPGPKPSGSTSGTP